MSRLRVVFSALSIAKRFYRLAPSQLDTRTSVFRVCKRLQGTDSKAAVNNFTFRTHTCGEVNEQHVGQRVKLCGWIQHERFGRFIVIKDAYGKVQLYNDAKKIPIFKKIRLDSVVYVTGIVHKRPPGEENPEMTSGSIEIHIEDAEVLSAVNKKLPILMHDMDHSEAREDLRIKYRHLFLRRDDIQHNLRLRSKLIHSLRTLLLEDFKFIEVETPTLFKRTPGGAQEFVVPTRTPDHYFALVQSPQILKQLLMIGAVDRYFQIARCYRDEATRGDRQPEFTQLDLELSFTTMSEVMALVEQLLRRFWRINELPGVLPDKFACISHADAIKKYGTDKPDARLDWEIKDLTHYFQTSQGNEELQWRALVIPGQKDRLNGLNSNDFWLLPHFRSHLKCQLYGFDVSAERKLDLRYPPDESVEHDLFKNFESNLSTENINPGDFVLLSCGSYPECNLILGKTSPLIAQFLHDNGCSMFNGDPYQFLWVVNFPLFEIGEDGSLESAHHPFTAPIDEHKELLFSNPLTVLAQHYDLVLNGHEIAGGSIRIHDSEMQKYIFDKILKVPTTEEDGSPMAFFLEALESGAPPHGGIAIGLDRLIALLCGTSNIKNVIAFPKNSEGRDLLSRAPGPISERDLTLYHLLKSSSSPS